MIKFNINTEIVKLTPLKHNMNKSFARPAKISNNLEFYNIVSIDNAEVR